MISSGRANHPGRLLGKWLVEKNISQRKFSEIIGKSYVDINNIIHGKKDINVDFAMRIGLALGTSPDVWLGMQKTYDIYKAATGIHKKEYLLIPIKAKELCLA